MTAAVGPVVVKVALSIVGDRAGRVNATGDRATGWTCDVFAPNMNKVAGAGGSVQEV